MPLRQAQTAAARSPLAAWRSSNFGSNTTGIGDMDDFNRIGVVNLLEFAVGMNPVTSTPGPLQYYGTFAGGGTITTTGRPVTAVENTIAGPVCRALYVRRRDFAAAGLTYTVKFTEELQGWTPGGGETVLADDGVHQIVGVPFPAFLDGKPCRISKVEVTVAP